MGGLFNWSETFLTGIDTVDAQHARLQELINNLASSALDSPGEGKADFFETHEVLVNYALSHFTDEEVLMEEEGIDARFIRVHKAQHQSFMEEISNLGQAQSEEALHTSLTFLLSWLSHHILDIDKSMARQLQSLQQGASPAEAYEAEQSRKRSLTDPLLAHIRQEHREAEQKIRRLAYYDSLTELPNRARFLELVQQAISAEDGRPVALFLLDIDRFKEVNDTLGHGFGDILLQQVGARLRSIMFDSDIVARLGGDEFGVLARMASVDEVEGVADKIALALDAPIMIEDLAIVVEASIGVALAPKHAADAGRLLQRADVAMYQAKGTGSGHAVYDPAFDPHSPERLALLGELRKAIDADELVLHYQPKIDLRTGEVIGAEALVRWHHPTRGMVPPDQFILIAERTGLIKPLTHWVLGSALRQCQTWRREGGPPCVAVNLSARSLYDPNLSLQIESILHSCAVPAEALELEITESAIIVDPTRAIGTLNRLMQMGLRIAIDDFGTGYTSLGAIRRLPAHEIKIDKSFVLGMTGNKSEEVIARVILDLGRNLGFKVVAEGVETLAAARRLAALGCDFAQGYLISKPLPGEQFNAWFAGYRPVSYL
ncbi:putative bifunctional diguanylate cyclase/phosphodiesterase [Arenimonas alkanexedens]